MGSLIRMKLEETGPSKIITHMVGLEELFPDIDIENLLTISSSCSHFLSWLSCSPS